MKRWLAALFVAACLAAGLLPASAFATEPDPLDGATTYYVSNRGGGTGESEGDPARLEDVLAEINATDGTGKKFVISIVENIERTQTMDFYFERHVVTLLGNGHEVRSSEAFGAHKGAVLHIGKADGSDTLILKELQRSQAHAVVAAAGGEVHMYDGVSVLGADDAYENDSTGHGVSANSNGSFYMHGGLIDGFCDRQPGAGVIVADAAFHMTGGTIQNCQSKLFGGGAVWGDDGYDIRITGGILKDNRSDGRGGAIATQGLGSIVLEKTVLSGNSSAGNGGAISVIDGAPVSVADCVFQSNVSEAGYGGAVHHQRASSGANGGLSVIGSEFVGNKATHGGAVLSLGGAGNDNPLSADFEGCTFSGNLAMSYEREKQGQVKTVGGFGGAIYVQDVELSLDGGAIDGNEAEDSGGGIYFAGKKPELSSLSVAGALKVRGNVAPHASNLYLSAYDPGESGVGEKFQPVLTVAGALDVGADRAQIGVSMDVPGVFTSGYSQYAAERDPALYFRSDSPDHHVSWNDAKSEALLAEGALQHRIAATAGVNGSISPSGEIIVQEGKDCTFAIVANDGYRIADVLVDGVSVGAKDSYTFEAVQADHTIEASFEKVPSGGSAVWHVISASAQGGGSVEPGGEVSVPHGGSKAFSIVPADGCKIVDVLVDGVSVGAVGSYVFEDARANHVIQAVFAKNGCVADPDDTGVSGWLNTEDHVAYLHGYGAGIFGPTANMTRAEAAQMFYNLLLDKNVPATATFVDVSADAWYAEPVNTLAALGVVEGIGGNRFAPDRPVTRAEFTAIAMRFAEFETGGENPYSDVSADDWFYDYVVGSSRYGWIEGYEDGTFRPHATIARAEATAITNRMLGRAADERYVDEHEGELVVFFDVSKDYWGYYHIVEATNGHDYTKSGDREEWTKLHK